MSSSSYGDQDPIAALATPLGESALALIRTSGEAAIEIVASVFSRPAKLINAPSHTVVHGWIVDPSSQKKIDEVLISIYRSPNSYTGEDCADISCHGGIAVVKAIMSLLKASGFRDALPGEFSFRAFMNGKLDLTKAESVMELVSSKTNRAREQAVRRLSGILQNEINDVKNLLVRVLAGIEIYLDYSEDEFSTGNGDTPNDEEAGRLPDRELAEEAASRLQTLAGLWQQERIYAEGALAVLAGRPNAGKSSLFNYLIREDRSIVTDIPGTTRDWIEALISVDDIPLKLADTAGLRKLREADEAERMGIERSHELLENADLVLYVIDGTEGITQEDRDNISTLPEKRLIVLWNKADLAKPVAPKNEDRGFPGSVQMLAVSAKTGEGISDLLRLMAGLLETPKAAAIKTGVICGPGTLRQKELIDSALASVMEALGLAANEEPLDIIAPLFRSAIDALGEITGEISNADILETMFSSFCVGK